MSEQLSNAEITRKVIDHVSNYEFDQINQHIHEDIVIEVPFQAFHAGPMRRGKELFMSGMQVVPSVFKKFKLNIHELYDCPGQDVVVFEQTSMAIFAANGATYQNRYIMVFGFRDGKINLWREFFNPELMNAGWRFMLDG